MATVTHGVSTSSTANATSYTSGSFTPAVGDLLVVCVVASATVAAGAVTASANGVSTFTNAVSATKNAGADTIYIFVANQLTTGTASMTVTFTCTGDSATGAHVIVERISGQTNVGTAAIRSTGSQSNQAAGTPSVTLDNTALTTSVIVGVVGTGTNGTANAVPPSGFTERADQGYSTPTTGVEVATRNSGHTSNTVTWGGATPSAFGAAVVEIDTRTIRTLGQPAETNVARPFDSITYPPTFVFFGQVANWSVWTTSPRQVTGVSWEAGDEIYVIGLTAYTTTALGTPTASGLSFSLVQSYTSGSGPGGYLWRAVASDAASDVTVSATPTVDTDGTGIAVLVVRDSGGIGTNPAAVNSADKSMSLARSSDNSAVIFAGADATAAAATNDGTPSTGLTERVSVTAGDYGVYIATWDDQGTAATTNYGQTGSAGNWTKLALEILPFRDYNMYRQVVTLGLVTETNAALAITREANGTPVGQVAETDTAQATARVKIKTLGQVVESDSAQTLTPRKTRSAGLLVETDEALTAARQHRKTTGLVTETDAALALSKIDPINRVLGQAGEIDAVLALGPQRVRVLGLNTEVDAALAPTKIDPINQILGQAGETDSTLALGRRKTRLLGQVTETNLTQSMGKVDPILAALGQLSETDLPLALSGQRLRALGPAFETDAGVPVAGRKVRTLGLVSESDAPLPLTPVRARAIGTATEADTAFAFGRYKIYPLAQQLESDAVASLGQQNNVPIGLATETDAALTFARRKSAVLGQPSATDTLPSLARARSRILGAPAELDAVQTASGTKIRTLGQVSETGAALSLVTRKTRALVQPSESNAVLAPTRRKSQDAGIVAETDTSPGITPKSSDPVVGPVAETDTVLAISARKVKSLGQPAETTNVTALRALKRATLGQLVSAEAAQGLAGLKRLGLGTTEETDQVTAVILNSGRRDVTLRVSRPDGRQASALPIGRHAAVVVDGAECTVRVAEPRRMSTKARGHRLAVVLETE